MVTAASLSTAALANYPPLGRQLLTQHLETLRPLSVVLVALLLRQARNYDTQFPVEQRELRSQLEMLDRPHSAKLAATLEQFGSLPLSAELQALDWAAEPERFVEKLTAYLWTAHAVDRFHAIALEYGDLAAAAVPPEPVASVPRLCIVLLGAGAPAGELKLLTRLQPYGTLFAQVDTAHAVEQATKAVLARAQDDPRRYAHWYVEGGVPAVLAPDHVPVATVSYRALLPMRQALLARLHTARTSGTVGPEDIRSMLADLQPADFERQRQDADPVLERFELDVLTGGSGTQIFSTTFVQWTAREVLRRARPRTLLVRYGLRQVERPMDDLLVASSAGEEMDPRGSLIDAGMGAYYTWINLQRLSNPESNRFLVCIEGTSEALAIGPGMARGAVSRQACDTGQLLRWLA